MLDDKTISQNLLLPAFSDNVHQKIMRRVVNRSFAKRFLFGTGMFFLSAGLFTLYFTFYFMHQDIFFVLSKTFLDFEFSLAFFRDLILIVSQSGLLDSALLLVLLVLALFMLTRLSLEPFHFLSQRSELKNKKV